MTSDFKARLQEKLNALPVLSNDEEVRKHFEFEHGGFSQTEFHEKVSLQDAIDMASAIKDRQLNEWIITKENHLRVQHVTRSLSEGVGIWKTSDDTFSVCSWDKYLD
jgi:hypothetical protein